MMMMGQESWLFVESPTKSVKITLDDFDRHEFSDGDTIRIVPETAEQAALTTPDGCKHVRSSAGDAIRVPPIMQLTSFRDFVLPEHLVVLTGRGSDTLEPFGRAHIASYQKHMGLTEDMTFLEIGCGIGRDAFQLMDIISDKGCYVGVDVTREAIAWCQNNISARRPNFEFHHFDAEHELYNPLGLKTSMDFSLPIGDKSVDRVALGSVFTHLFEEEITHYLREIARVLKPGGLAYATFFLHSPETIEAVKRTNVTPLRFEHPYGDGCFVESEQYPTGAVAFTDKVIRRMIKNGGLKMTRPYLGGAWSGLHRHADDGQEVAILTLAPPA